LYLLIKIKLSSEIKREINADNDDCPLPFIIESTFHQAFATVKKLRAKPKTNIYYKHICSESEFHEIIKGHTLLIARKMQIDDLKKLIKLGFTELENELLRPLNDALAAERSDLERRKENERHIISEDGNIIENMFWNKLREKYSAFEAFIFTNKTNSSHMQMEGISEVQNDTDLKRIHEKYPNIKKTINTTLKITSENWIELRKLFEFITQTIDTQLVVEENETAQDQIDRDEAIKELYNLLVDQEIDFYKQVTKLFQEKKKKSQYKDGYLRSKTKQPFTFDINNIILSVDAKFKQKTDSQFIHDLQSYKFENDEIKKNYITSRFLNAYQVWRNEIFYPNMKKCIPKYSDQSRKINSRLEDESKTYQKQIKDREFTRICEIIEKQYSDGPTFKIESVIASNDRGFHITYHLEEIQPEQLQYTIYNTSLDQNDILSLIQDELHISNPTPKILHSEEHCLIAVNEPKGMIGIYQTKIGVLDVYVIDEDQQFYKRSGGVQICALYGNYVPDIKFLFFIKDKEEICFVQTDGHARIFNLVADQFFPATAHFPINASDIVCTPDGSCIVAFVEENVSEENSTDGNMSHTMSNEQDNESNTSINDTASNSDSTDEPNGAHDLVVNRAYIYFCSDFGRPASKVINLPPIISTLEFIQFSCMENQIHLTTFDIHAGIFRSLIIKITKNTRYSFQRFNKRSLGKVRAIKNFSQDMELEGKNTSFMRDVKKGENLVIMGEKRVVLKVYSNKKLRVSGTFQCMIGINSWMEFHIEPKPRLNGYIDAYNLMFGKYPIDNIIDPDQNQALNLQIALDLKDNEKISNYENKFQDYVADMFKELKKSTNKPANSIKRFGLKCLPFSDFDLEDLNEKFNDLKKSQLGEWIIQLCILIPIQIAVARNNIFQPLCNGLLSFDAELSDSGALSIDGIVQNISFGWYEGIFKYFGDRPVKVVSSMGELYMLNHSIGTTFDCSAMRCTEGVWMSLAITKKCVYVALDFEGLKSFERSPQEDTFLTLFNTVISNLILFKNQFAVNRDMSTMFQRFQDGATLLKDEQIFQAKLCIIIKDVPKRDRDGIMSEFSLRFSEMVMQEGENNFITKMFSGGLSIYAWPKFNNPEWYKSLIEIKKMLDKQDAKYNNARAFLQNTKVFMAKLKICDWDSLDENLVQIRVSTLKRLLDIAISLGIEEKTNTIEHLTNRDTGEIIPDQVIKLTDIYDDIEDGCDLILDSDIQLLDENTEFVPLSVDLRLYFENKIQCRRNCSNDTIWFETLSKFFKLIVRQRINRVQEWFQQNTSKFSHDNSYVKDGAYALDQLVNRLSLLWTLCGLSCQECNLKCLKNRYHEDLHDCLTDHNCYATCEFVDAHFNGLFPRCSRKAGHDGKHACNTTSHLCSKPCKFSDKRNCQKKCAKEIGHEDEEHICQSKRHNCGAPCSLQANTKKGFYKCPNKCIIPCEDEHKQHCCENDSACPIQCPIPDCQRRCQSTDHFHALKSQQIHFCGNEHQCQEDCQELGVCRVLTEPRKQDEVYQSLVQGTSITFTKCILPYGHPQTLHETKHGNMTRTEFTSEVEYRGHKLSADDHGTFVLCNLYCKQFGRHRHIVYYQDASTCKPSANKRHIDDSIEPHPEKPKDYISHSLFWERTGFKDPYTAKEQEIFKKCYYECPDKLHRTTIGSNIISNRSFCELPLFHAPLKLSDAPPNGIGYISPSGHHFKCDDPAKREGSSNIRE
ncbi:16953_t:CDS:10, partial [Gigaspora margarita]